MESFVRLSFAVLFMICAARIVSSCSCERSHPQKSLCKDGTFAALVKVRNIELVYFATRPRIQSNQSRNSSDGILSENLGLNKRGKSHKGNEEMERVEVVVKESDLTRMLHTQFLVTYIRFRVKVYETFKGLKAEEVDGKKVYIYTPQHESFCGVSLKEKETYLLMGSIGENRRLKIGICNYRLHWNSLQTKQKRVIKRNMRAARKTCQSGCAVNFCDNNWMRCQQVKDMCLWTSQMEKTNNKLNVDKANYVCKRELGKQAARCIWTDGLADAKRGRRRRRRNHTSGLRLREQKRRTTP